MSEIFNRNFFLRFVIVSLFSLAALFLFGMLLDFPGRYTANLWIIVPAYVLFYNIASEGNLLIDKYLNEKYPWFISARRRLIVQTVIALVWTFLVITIPFAIRLLITASIEIQNPKFVVFNLATGTLFIVAFNSIYIANNFFRNWKTSLLEIEKLKQEKLKSDYKLLQDQINPHFLFNSLSVLMSEIKHDPAVAYEFTKKLSDVYRYVLQTRNHQTVTLQKELQSVNAFIYLHKIRLGEKLKIFVSIPEELNEKYLPPMTLQVLTENAIKHNIATEAKPLQISIAGDSNGITITNNLQEKTIIDSTQTGLSNIKMRYSLLGSKNIEINKTGNDFRVFVPLLEE